MGRVSLSPQGGPTDGEVGLLSQALAAVGVREEEAAGESPALCGV